MRARMSAKLTPAAATRMVTSPSRGSGSAAPRTSSTPGPPIFGIHTCRTQHLLGLAKIIPAGLRLTRRQEGTVNNRWTLVTLGIAALGATSLASTLPTVYLLRQPAVEASAAPADVSPPA